MNIVVCVKQVPNTTEIKIDPVTNTLKRDGIPSIMNPDDKAALEYALVLREQVGGSVTVISMGPPQAENMLREGLAMGADRAVLVGDRAFAGSDTWATSTILSAAIKKIGYDLVLAGRQAIDGDTAQVGPQIAELLKIPQVTYIKAVEPCGETLTVKRQFEDRYQMISLKTPALLTILGEGVTPRYMHVNGIVAQENQEVEKITLNDIVVNISDIGLKGSPTKVKSTFAKKLDTEKQLLETDNDASADAILAVLKQKHVI